MGRFNRADCDTHDLSDVVASPIRYDSMDRVFITLSSKHVLAMFLRLHLHDLLSRL